MTRPTAQGVLAALLASALLLIGVEASRSTRPVQIAKPCATRALFPEPGIEGTIQQVVLSGLDRAACTLGTSREALVLALGGSSAGGTPHFSRARIDAAVRAGLLGALAGAEQRGAVPTVAHAFLVKLIRTAPIDQLVRGSISLADLLR
jgi:hypothetical protein